MTRTDPRSPPSDDTDELIDHTVEDSFPASDPPSWTTTIAGIPGRPPAPQSGAAEVPAS